MTNAPGDDYEYEVYVYTGTKTNSETESNVYFSLSGTKGHTGKHQLKDGVRKVGTVKS